MSDEKFTKLSLTRGQFLRAVVTSSVAAGVAGASASAQTAGDPPKPDGAGEVVLPRPEEPFKGKIGRTAKDSTPDFPKGIEAPAGAPNVIIF